MKIRQLITVLTMILVGSFIASCQKAVGDPQLDNPPVEAGGKLPQRVKIHYFSDNYTEVSAIQYDTSNRTIRIFSDDTTTVNPYDALLAQYDYNEAGYLVKLHTIHDDQDTSTNIIARNVNNQISYITGLDEYPGEADTTFFVYSQTPAGNVVETYYRYPDGIQPETSHKRFTYSSQWRLLKTEELAGNPFTINYQYSQDLFTGYIVAQNGTNVENIELDYTSGLPFGGTDQLLALLCGKDYYLLQLKGLNYFSLFRDAGYFHLSMTDPWHPTRLSMHGVDQDNVPTEDVITYNYQVNTSGQVVRIGVGHEYDPAEILFTY